MVTISYSNNQCINNLCTSYAINITSQLSWPPGAFFKKIKKKKTLAGTVTNVNEQWDS